MMPSINGIMSPLHNVIIKTRQKTQPVSKRGFLSPDPISKQYRSIKLNSYTFTDPPTDRSFAVNKTAQQRRTRMSYDFDQAIGDQLLTEARRRITELELTIEAMSLRLQEMRDVNKRLLSEKLTASAGESQTMFQQLLLTDMDGVVDNLRYEYGTLREQNEEMRRRLEATTKDKKTLLTQVKRYKQLLAEKVALPVEPWLDTLLSNDAPRNPIDKPPSHLEDAILNKVKPK